jgi:hypothetical protein
MPHPRPRAAALRLALLLAPALPVLAQSPGNHCHVRLLPLQGLYAGDCSGGIAHGRGRAQGVDVYEGEWREGLPHGLGVYRFADGRRFEGRFEAGKVQGLARFVYANGDLLEGEFRGDQLAGTGRLVRAGGEALAVQMQGGALVVVAGAPAATAPASPPAAAAPPPALGPAVPATPALPAAAPVAQALCEGRLRVQALALRRTAPGLLRLELSVENLANADVRLDATSAGAQRQTHLVDEQGTVWRALPPRRDDGLGFEERIYQPGQATPVALAFGLASGGQGARRMAFNAVVAVRAAHAGAPPGLAGTCRFELRGLSLPDGP